MLPLPRGAVWQALFLLCAVLFLNEVRSEGRVVCYYTNWSVYRPGTAKFNPQNINPYLCTHLVYAFGGFTKDNQMKPFDKYQDIEQGGYAKFTGLKTYNKQLKTMIAIGGWNEASSRFSPLVANSERRQQFIKNILKFLRQNHFDGIDLDWEYPAHRQGGKSRDRDNYAQFVQELRAEFEREAEKTGRPRLLLTMAVPAGIEYIDKGYDIPKLNKYLDWFNLLSYDFHSSHEPSANHHAPLYSLEEESEYNYDTELNIDYSVKYYLKAGADRDKLVLGIPTYGRSYTLINEESTDIGAPSEGPGEQGDATREKGYLAYYEICQNLKEDPEWTVVQPNPNAMGPYAFRRNQWVGYDDEDIVRKKAQYVVEHGLGGIMFWAIDNDDFRGTCTGKPYPLIEAAKEAMLEGLGLGINEVAKPSSPKKPLRSRSRENSSSSRNRISDAGEKSAVANRKETARRPVGSTRKQITTEAPRSTTIKLTEAEGSSLYVGGRTTTPPPPTTPDPGTDFKCEEEGFFQHPRDCKKYYWCLDSGPSGLGIVAHQFTCPSGLYFNPAADSCDFARNVPCKTKKSTTAAPVTSTTTTTPRPTTSSNRITAATSRNSYLRTTTRRTTTTTTTEAPAQEEDEEVEYEDEQNEPSISKDRDPEEDPKVIQELIDLIRKLGGIEELEKYLLRKEDGSISLKEQNSSSSVSGTKSSGITKTLFEKVLSRPNTYNSFRNRLTSSTLYKKNTQSETDKVDANSFKDTDVPQGAEAEEEVGRSSGGSSYSKYSSVVRGNSRQGPQNEGLEKLPEFDAFIKEKKQYVTINRNRGSIRAQQDEEEEGAEEDDEENVEILDEEIVTSNRRPIGSSGSTQTYSTIRRNKSPTVVKSTIEEDLKRDEEERLRIEQENNEKKIYATLNRTRGRFPTTEQPAAITSDDISTTNRYKYFERTRPTKPTTLVTDADELEANDENEEEQENVMVQLTSQSDSATQKSQTTRLYASIGRKTTTTTIAPTESTIIETPTKIATIITNQSDTTTYSTEPTPEPISTSTATPTTSTTTNKPELITTTSHPIASTSTSTILSTKVSTLNAVDSSSLYDSTTIVPDPILPNSDITKNSGTGSFDKNSLVHENLPTSESGLDTSNQDLSENIAKTITTAKTTTRTLTTTGTTDTDGLAVDDDKVTNLNKNLTKTQYKYVRTRNPQTTTRTNNNNNASTTNTTTTTKTVTSNNNSVQNSLNSDNGKGSNSVNVKYSGGRRQQIKQTDSLYNIKSQIQTQQTPTTLPTTEPTPTNEFLGTVSSPRPFGFPRRRTRPSSTTTTETSNILSTVEQNTAVEDSSSFIKSTENTKKKYQTNRLRTSTPSRTRTINRSSATSNGSSNEDRQATSQNKDQVKELEDASTVGSTTSTESTSSFRPNRPTPRRVRVLKYRRPVGSVNATLVDSNINATTTTTTSVTNTINTSLNLSVDQAPSVVSHLENTNSKTIITQNSETAQTKKTSETPANESGTLTKRFRKVVRRKLIRPIQKNTTEATEIQSSTEAANELVATANPRLTPRRRNGTRYGNYRSPNFNLVKEKSNNDLDAKRQNIITTSPRGKARFFSENQRSTSTERIPSAVSRVPLFGTASRSRLSGRTSTSTTEASNIEEETEDNLVADLDDDDDDEKPENAIATEAKFTPSPRLKLVTRRPTTAAFNELNFEISTESLATASHNPAISLNTPIIVESQVDESDELTTEDESLDDVEETTDENSNVSLTTKDALEMKDDNKLKAKLNKAATTSAVIDDNTTVTEEIKESSKGQPDSKNYNSINNKVFGNAINAATTEELQETTTETSKESVEFTQTEEVEEETPTTSYRLPKLLRQNVVTSSKSSTVDESEIQTDVYNENESLSTRKPFIPASKLKAIQTESKTLTTDEVISETSPAAPNVRPSLRRTLISKRPYTPTRPSLSAISNTKQSTSFEPKRKFTRRKYGQFNKIYSEINRTNEDDEDVRSTSRDSQLPAFKRLRVQNRQRVEQNGEDDDQNGEQYEEDEEAIEEQPVGAVISRPPGLFNRQKFSTTTTTTEQDITEEKSDDENTNEENVDEESEDEDGVDNEEDIDGNGDVAEIDDEEEKDEEINYSTELPNHKYNDLQVSSATPTVPTKPVVNIPFNPNYRKPPSFKNYLSSSSPTSRFGSSSSGYGRSTKRPHVINRPQGPFEPTPTVYPNTDTAYTAVDTDDSAVNELTNTHTYERKYSGHSKTETLEANGDNVLIEDLDIEALNARNKKIFESHSKKHTTPKIFTTKSETTTSTTTTTTTEHELEQQQQLTKQNTETENNNAYDSTYSGGHANGFITTTPATPTNHNQNTVLSTNNYSNQISSQDNEGSTTSTPPTTTLVHVFTLIDEDEQTSRPTTGYDNQTPILLTDRVQPKHKVVEINRIVEVTSKEDKLRRKSKTNPEVLTKLGTSTLKVESLPHVEQLGEISVVKYVHLVNGGDILIDGHSTVADYTPTEATTSQASIPVRNSPPEQSASREYAQLSAASESIHDLSMTSVSSEERYGKALVPEVIREAVETSTIALEGLFDGSRKGKKLNTNKAATANELSMGTSQKQQQQTDSRIAIVNPQTGVPTLISAMEILPETTTAKLIIASEAVPTIVLPSFVESSTEPATTESTTLTTDANFQPETSTTESTINVKATPVPVALFPTYVRPIVPLLRPESNESSPLVISIANLDKVILSKVLKTDADNDVSASASDSSADFSSRRAAVVAPPTNQLSTESHAESGGGSKYEVAKTLGSQKGSVVDVSNASGDSHNKLNTNYIKSERNSQSSVSEIVSFSSETHVVHKKRANKHKARKLRKFETTTTRAFDTTTTDNDNNDNTTTEAQAT